MGLVVGSHQGQQQRFYQLRLRNAGRRKYGTFILSAYTPLHSLPYPATKGTASWLTPLESSLYFLANVILSFQEQRAAATDPLWNCCLSTANLHGLPAQHLQSSPSAPHSFEQQRRGGRLHVLFNTGRVIACFGNEPQKHTHCWLQVGRLCNGKNKSRRSIKEGLTHGMMQGAGLQRCRACSKANKKPGKVQGKRRLMQWGGGQERS